MSAKDNKPEVLEKPKVKFLLEATLFLHTDGFKHILSYVLMHMLAVITKTATGTACNVYKTLG